MRIKKLFFSVLIAGFTGGSAMAGSGHEKSAHGQDPVLPGGSYTAKAKSIVCGGCGSLIEKTMRGTPGIEAAKVDPKTGQVDFTVKKGQEVKWSELQKALKVSAGKMGMGADYTLTNFRVAGHRPHGDVGGRHRDRPQRRNGPQVDQALGAGQAKLHCLHQALAAGQVAGVGALSGSDRGIDRCRPLIIECVHG